MIEFVIFVEGPDVLLVEVNNGSFAVFGHMDQNGVQLSRIGVLHLSLLLVIDVDLFLGEVDVAY